MNKKPDLIQSIANYVWSRAKSTQGYWLTRFVFLRFLGLELFHYQLHHKGKELVKFDEFVVS